MSPKPVESQPERIIELPLEHFTLQLEFAKIASENLGISLEDALLKYTQFYRRVGNDDYDFDKDAPKWREFVERAKDGNYDQVAYDIYLAGEKSSSAVEVPFGCFRYKFKEEDEGMTNFVEIHFHNRDLSGFGPLSSERYQTRLAELKAMFIEIKKLYPQAKSVSGGSWLYNIEAYRRLYPESYTNSRKPELPVQPQYMGIWGQFLNSKFKVNEERASALLEKARKAKTEEELLEAFEFKMMKTFGPIEDFYKVYGIK